GANDDGGASMLPAPEGASGGGDAAARVGGPPTGFAGATRVTPPSGTGAASTSSTLSPILTRSPGVSVATDDASSRRPFTHVPFKEPRSSISSACSAGRR